MSSTHNIADSNLPHDSFPGDSFPEPRTIAFIHTGALGDFVLSLHIAARLRLRFPGAALTAVCKASHAALAELTGLFRRHFDLDAGGFHWLFAPAGSVDPHWSARLTDFDLILDLTGPPDSTFGQRLAACCRGAVVSIDPSHRPDESRHITEQWLADLARAGLKLPRAQPFQVDFPPAEHFKTRARLQHASPTAGRPIVLVHPGSGAVAKCWPLDHFQNVVLTLIAESVQPIWMIGPVERDRWDPAVGRDLEQLAPLLFEENLRPAAELVAAADAFVGNDSGMSHVAAFMGTPAVVIFGPTPASVWQPLGRRVHVLAGAGAPAAPFAGIDAGAVGRAVLSLIADTPIGA